MPAVLHCLIASITSSRGGSIIAVIPKKSRSVSASAFISPGSWSNVLYPKNKTLKPSAAHPPFLSGRLSQIKSIYHHAYAKCSSAFFQNQKEVLIQKDIVYPTLLLKNL